LPEQVELSDQDLVDRPDDERAILLAELSTDDWKAIRRVHGQAAVLEAAERGKDELASALYTLTASRTGPPSDAGPDTPRPTPAPFVNERHSLGFCLSDIGRIRL
jgi:hypothetical protein